MAKAIKVRAKEKGGVVTVKALMSHPMETGQRKNKKTGKMIPAHYIQEVTVEHQGKTVMTANWGPAVSKNPYMSFTVSGGKEGDTLTVSWLDNKGATASLEEKIK
ncbi:MAG: thiosulfate oxidation carrier complex protein SoxZ [Gammaproteobacteria bacterium]|nr:MAG: thiosulfate oxidation carrier complex protein SoxZ [Gammaproteobacteria bacterium]